MLPRKMALTGGAAPSSEDGPVSTVEETSPESVTGTSELVEMPPEPPKGGPRLLIWRVGGVLKTMRPHQWVKNVFVLAPIVFAREMFVWDLLIRSIGAFGVFCLLAGAVYTMNDLVDLDGDAVHPVKRFRPLPSGRVPLSWGRHVAIGLVIVSLAGAAIGPWQFLVTAIAYFMLNVAYSFRLKKIAYVDVGLIALGFVLRVLAGGFATNTPISGFMVGCTALLALFLGFGKRRHELATAANAGKQRAALEAYSPRALTLALAATGIATIGTYLAYTLDHDTQRFFQNPWLWVTTIHPLFGVVRFLQLVVTRPKAESPTQEILRDVPFILNLVVWVAEVIFIVYRLRPT